MPGAVQQCWLRYLSKRVPVRADPSPRAVRQHVLIPARVLGGEERVPWMVVCRDCVWQTHPSDTTIPTITTIVTDTIPTHSYTIPTPFLHHSYTAP